MLKMMSLANRLLLGAVTPAVLLASPAVGAAATTPLHQGPLHRLLNGSSTNWSGYAATGTTFTSVSGSWTQPSITCTNKPTYSSFWVGLDGDGSSSVEQTGTGADCVHGVPVYFGWYEMYPAAPVTYSLPVKAGDSMSAAVTTNGSGTFTLKLSDASQNWVQTTTATSATAALASAEVIAEAPSKGSVAPLADFGTANFSSVLADGRPIGSFNPESITMVSKSGIIKAQPSSLSGGENFSDTWYHS